MNPACSSLTMAPAGQARTVAFCPPRNSDLCTTTRPLPDATAAITPAPGEGGAPHPVVSEPPADEADLAAWATAHAVPIGLIGLGVTAVAVALGSLGMKRARHRNEVMRRYRP